MSQETPSLALFFTRPLGFNWRRAAPAVQVGALIVIWLAGEALVSATHLPVPGGLMGFFALLAALWFRWIPLQWVKEGASSLLRHLMLFFIPAMLSLLGHPELLGWDGLKLLLATLLGTVLVMAGTAGVVEGSFRWRMHRRHAL